MRKLRAVLCGVLVIAAAGCVTSEGYKDFGKEGDTRKSLFGNDRIEISASSRSGIYGGPEVKHAWILERSGRCVGTVTMGKNAGYDKNEVRHYECPPEVYDECRAILRKTGFYWMRDRRPKQPFEPDTSSITVKSNWREHDVTVVSGAGSPSGYKTLWDFVAGLSERGKLIEKAPDAADASPRTED